MRIPLVPSVTVFLGLALVSGASFFPVHVDQAALPAGMAIEEALQTARRPLVLAGLFSVLAGGALFGRAFASTGLFEVRLYTGLAAALTAAALIFSAAVPVVMVEWSMTPDIAAASAWSYLLCVSLLAAALLLVRRHLTRRHRSGTASGEATLSTHLAIAALAVMAASPAHAISLGEMADAAAEDLELLPTFISIAFYVLGVAIAGFGLLRLKRHVEQPSQTTLPSGLIALLIGAALIVAPSVINAVAETFAVDNATITRPVLDP